MAELQQPRWPMWGGNAIFWCSAAKATHGVYVMFIVNLFIAASEAVADWRRRQRAYADLMALDDRSLADIGVHRSQIRALVEGGRVHSADAARFKEEASYWSAQARLIGS
jgi:uncharacterized protein YjiS (DUF1127 family)